MMRGEGDCANIRRTRLAVFSLDENVTTPEDAEKGRVSSLLVGVSKEKKGRERGVPVIPMYRFGK